MGIALRLYGEGGGHYSCRGKTLKGMFAKNERGYMLMAKNKRFRSLIISLLSFSLSGKNC